VTLRERLHEVTPRTSLDRAEASAIRRICDAHDIESVLYLGGKKSAIHIIYEREAYLISTREKWATFRQEVQI